MLPVHDCNAAQLLGSGRAMGGLPAAGLRGTSAMAKMPSLLRQRQKIDEAELELDQKRMAARLADIFGRGAATDAADAPQAGAPAEAADADPATIRGEPPEADAPVGGRRRGRTRAAIVVEPGPSDVGEITWTREPGVDDPPGADGTAMVGVMVGPGLTVAAGPGTEWWSAAVDYALIGNDGAAGTADTDGTADPRGAAGALDTADTDFAADAGTLADTAAWSEALAEADEAVAPRLARVAGAIDAPPAASQPDPAAPAKGRSASEATKREPAKRRAPEPRSRTTAQPGGKGSRSTSARRPMAGKAAPKAAAVIASCPYCAVLLEPPPTTSRSCPRCRQRIVVKRIEGRVVYLTEAAVAFFEAERRRIARAARFTRERARWLKLAAAAGAPPQRAARLVAAQLSEETVDAARTLYMNTEERAFRSAKRERRWEDASRIRREQVMALFRLAGSGSIPSEAVVTLHREGVAAELRGLAEIAREAELVSAVCCDACRADDGRIGRINQELLAPRLPHPGCPKGLCRCRWDLTARDRTILRRYQRRPVRANPRASQRAVPAAPQPAV